MVSPVTKSHYMIQWLILQKLHDIGIQKWESHFFGTIGQDAIIPSQISFPESSYVSIEFLSQRALFPSDLMTSIPTQ
jgi:hypothetical protein